MQKKMNFRQMRKATWGIAVLLSLLLAGAWQAWAASTQADGSKKAASKAKAAAPTRTRAEMIIEVELKALREALDQRQDQEKTSKFAERTEKEAEEAKGSANGAREMLQKSAATLAEAQTAKDSAVAAVDKITALANEARTLSENSKKEAKLAGVEAVGFVEMRKTAQAEVQMAMERETSALKVLQEARDQEEYYRSLVKRRMRNAEDFYYIAEAAMRKGGNSQSMEFAIKAKAEMQQAQVAENEANIRADATRAAEKLVESRKQSTEAAKIKAVAMAQMMKLSEEIAKALTEAFQAATASTAAAEKMLASTKNFSSSKDEVLTFSNKKTESLTSIKDAAEKKEALATDAAQSARAVVDAKQKALAEAESKAQSALAEAKTLVITTPAQQASEAAAAAQTAPATRPHRRPRPRPAPMSRPHQRRMLRCNQNPPSNSAGFK